MKLDGFTNSNEPALNCAILNLSRKLKISFKPDKNSQSEFWLEAQRRGATKGENNTALNNMTVASRIDWCIELANKLYKK